MIPIYSTTVLYDFKHYSKNFLTEYCSSDILLSLACNSVVPDFKLKLINHAYLEKYMNSPAIWRNLIDVRVICKQWMSINRVFFSQFYFFVWLAHIRLLLHQGQEPKRSKTWHTSLWHISLPADMLNVWIFTVV